MYNYIKQLQKYLDDDIQASIDHGQIISGEVVITEQDGEITIDRYIVPVKPIEYITINFISKETTYDDIISKDTL